MTDRETLRELIERVEQATEADRELDEAVYRSLGYWWDSGEAEWCAPSSPRAAEGQDVPAYTSSLDAAASLVPEGWQWWVNSRKYARCWFPKGDGDVSDIAQSLRCATPALALTAAALRARLAEMEAPR